MTTLVHAANNVVALFVDVRRERARDAAAIAAEILEHAGKTIAIREDQNAVLHLAKNGAPVDRAGLLITIGGDGTLLRGARIAAAADIPILGVNAGHLGFLTELDGIDAMRAKLPSMLEHGFQIEERIALTASAQGRDFFALNDVVVRKGAVSRIVPFGLCLGEEVIGHIPSDGIIVATPTGSTAYFLSAGGPIIAPGVEALGIGALLPHALFTRPLIVPASATITITCDSEILHANLETDGEVMLDLAPGDKVTVRRAARNVRFARTAPLSFFSLLEEKLRWGVSIKERA